MGSYLHYQVKCGSKQSEARPISWVVIFGVPLLGGLAKKLDEKLHSLAYELPSKYFLIPPLAWHMGALISGVFFRCIECSDGIFTPKFCNCRICRICLPVRVRTQTGKMAGT